MASPPGFAASLECLWELTLVNQPELREAAFTFAEARGRQIQAGKYLNPVFSYDETTSTPSGRQGDILMMVRQEIMTAGKFGLDKRIAATQYAAASLELTQKQFDLLTGASAAATSITSLSRRRTTSSALPAKPLTNASSRGAC